MATDKNKDKPALSLVDQVEEYVHQYLLDSLPMEYVYHNYDHAQEVAEVCKELAEDAKMQEDELENLLIAAWFHDTGYTGGEDGHEERSAAIAVNYLEEQGLSEEKVAKIAELIRSTHEDKKPISDAEKILDDAGWSFLSRKRFERRASLLQIEKGYLEGEKINELKWHKNLLQLLTKVPFRTTWAQDRFSSRRNKNIAAQQSNIDKAHKVTVRKRTGKDFGRGVDTIYRVTLRNHINLSSIADGKANMIISINTLVLSILITVGSASISMTDFQLDRDLSFIAPIVVLMISSLSATIFAVLSATPKVSGATFTEQDIKDHKVSLLFFGNFLQIPKDDFVEHMRDLKKNQSVLYDDLSRDLYNLGQVLRKKYILLIISYRLFIAGLVLSVVAFLVSYAFF